MMFRLVVKKLSVFDDCWSNGLRLYHEGGGVYLVLADQEVVRTKHIRWNGISID